MSVVQLLKNAAKFPVEALAGQFGQHRRQAGEARLWIMMYHRILPKNDPRYALEEPGMIVEPETFRMHLQQLRKEFTLMPLNEWVKRSKAGQALPPKSCAITFDDGWLDNYQYALPILEQQQVPATLFAVSGMVGTNDEFWPNRIVKLLNQPLEKIETIPWLYELAGNQATNSELSAQVIYSLKNLTDDEIIKQLDHAEEALGVSKNTSPTLMNWEQLRTFSDNDLIDIGSHTCHHVRLRQDLQPSVRFNEIVQSKKQLETQLEKPIELFCYPNGDYCDAALREVAEHYQAAVTTKPGINLASDSSFMTLKRFGVHQDISYNRRKLLARVANWP
jgi:peptidoglycan/xylan/chitin deacetylase (PgdA/CDA1 family)